MFVVVQKVTKIKSPDDHQILQNDLSKLCTWSRKWLLKFHPKKCSCLTIGKKLESPSYSYDLSSHIIEQVKSIKDIGVTLTITAVVMIPIYSFGIKEECSVFLKKIILWMKTIHYQNTLRSHLVTIVPMAPFTPKSTSKLRSALHFSYSIVIRRFYFRANTAQY